MLTDTTGPAVFVGLGYVAAVGVQIAASGWPVTVSVDLLIPLAYFCMLLAALGIGSLVGTVMRALPAASVALLALGAWYLLPFTVHREWGNVTGTVLVSDPVPGLDYAVLPSMVALVSVASITMAALALALIVVKVTRGWLWFAVILTLSSVGVMANARAISGDWPASPYANRTDELICDGNEPRICLWPEQEAEAGELVRSTLNGAYLQALKLGIPLPHEVRVDYGQSPHSDWIIINYAEQVMAQYACDMRDHPELSLTFQPPASRGQAEFSAQFGMELFLGADPSTVASITLEGMKDYANVHDLTQARAAVLAWAERGPTCE